MNKGSNVPHTAPANAGSIDLLDAGGADLASLRRKISQGGFRVVHTGKAQTRRTATDVYYAPGYEAEAREVAKLLGARAEAVQALTWKSPYAVTVAAVR